MSGRKGELALAQQVLVGAQVAAARARRVRWKVLEKRYGRCRRQLWRYVQVARDKMSHNSGKMSHNRRCLMSEAA